MGASYAVFTDTFKSDKKQVVEVGKTKIELIEPSTGLSLGSVEEMSDSNGLIQTNYYSFSVKNTGDSDAKYNLYLLDDADIISTYEGTLLDDKYLRVGLTKNETELGPLNLDTQKRLIDTGVIDAGSTNNYKLRLWLNFEGLTDSEKDVLDGQSKFLKLKLTGEQNFSHTLADTIIKRDLKTNKNEANGLFSTNDTNSGKPSYYYKGLVDNNYVELEEKTGKALYRIVRINEDGSVRLIRNDSIGNNAFNPSSNNYSYMYYSNSNVENGIMKRVNDWYASAIEETALDSKVVESNFCEQAKVKYSSSYTSGSAEMVILSKDYRSSLKCEVDGNGKGPLRMKVGLITEDEVISAGIPLYYNGITSAEFNTNTYLQMNGTNWYFWTMSPASFHSNGYTIVWRVSNYGYVDYVYVNYSGVNVHPVFSLSSSVRVEGLGTIDSPFTIK